AQDLLIFHDVETVLARIDDEVDASGLEPGELLLEPVVLRAQRPDFLVEAGEHRVDPSRIAGNGDALRDRRARRPARPRAQRDKTRDYRDRRREQEHGGAAEL